MRRDMPGSAEGRISVVNSVSAVVSFSLMLDEYAGVVKFALAYGLFSTPPN